MSWLVSVRLCVQLAASVKVVYTAHVDERGAVGARLHNTIHLASQFLPARLFTPYLYILSTDVFGSFVCIWLKHSSTFSEYGASPRHFPTV